MPAISVTTRILIKAYLETFLDTWLRNVARLQRRRRRQGIAVVQTGTLPLPFDDIILPSELRWLHTFQCALSTIFGTTFDECARLIAIDHHREVRRGYDLIGKVSQGAANEIENQVALFDRNTEIAQPKSSFAQMAEAVLKAQKDNDLVTRRARADLYILAYDGTEYFFEIKSPDINKGQCLEVNQRLLRFILLNHKRNPNTLAHLALPYNPYGPDKQDYHWSFPDLSMPFEEAVLIGWEFWNIVGGPTTLVELLDIYQEVGCEKAKYMIDALAFGF